MFGAEAFVLYFMVPLLALAFLLLFLFSLWWAVGVQHEPRQQRRHFVRHMRGR